MSDSIRADHAGDGTAAPANGSDISVSSTIPTAGDDLIDVSGMTFEQLATTLGAEDLGRALDIILASGQNEDGFHGFNSCI